MPAGFQSFFPDGSLQTDLTTRLSRVLGFEVVTQDGSKTVAKNPNTRLYAMVIAGSAVYFNSAVPTTSVSGNVISWSLNGAGGYQGAPNMLIWGEY